MNIAHLRGGFMNPSLCMHEAVGGPVLLHDGRKGWQHHKVVNASDGPLLSGLLSGDRAAGRSGKGICLLFQTYACYKISLYWNPFPRVQTPWPPQFMGGRGFFVVDVCHFDGLMR